MLFIIYSVFLCLIGIFVLWSLFSGRLRPMLATEPRATVLQSPEVKSEISLSWSDRDFIPQQIKTDDGIIQFIPRTQWRAQPFRHLDELEDLVSSHPIKYIIITHTGVGKSHETSRKWCFEALHTQQNNGFKMGWCDMPCNFYVGSDGTIYEGRGWNYVSATALGWNHLIIGIAFIGNFFDRKPTKSAVKGLKKFFDHMVEQGIATTDFTVYCLGQVRYHKFSELLDSELYAEIQTWKAKGKNKWSWKPRVLD